MVKKIVYDNGLRLIVDTNKRSKIISTGIMVNVGAIREEPHEYGLAHLVEHTMFKSTTTRNFKDISKILDGLGIKYNASTSKTCTYYYMDCIRESLEKTFEIFSDMFFNGVFDEEEIANEKKVVLEEMNMCEDSSFDILMEAVMKNMYFNKPLGHRVIGDRSIIENATSSTLRAFKEKYYTAENMVITMAGNISLEEADKMVREYFVNKYNYVATFTPRYREKIEPNIVKKYESIQKDEKQISVAILIKGPRLYEKDYDAFNIYGRILGYGRSSRLFDTLREKEGLCYVVDATAYSNICMGGLMIFVSTSKDKVAKSLQCIKEELHSIIDSVTEEELDRAKVSLKTDLIFANDSNSIMAHSNANELYDFGKVLSLSKETKDIEKVTLDDVKKIASKIAKERKYIVCAVGDSLDEEILKKNF